MSDRETGFLSKVRRILRPRRGLVLFSKVDLPEDTKTEDLTVIASRVEAKGRGIRLRKIFSFGSRIDIDTGE